MNGIQGRKKNSSDTDIQLDGTDASTNYNSLIEDIDNSIELEFKNPVFKLREAHYTGNNTQDDNEDYDRLNKPKIQPRPSPKIPDKQSKLKSDEIEMGVKNIGYANDKQQQRSQSWESNISALNPYAIDTAINQPPISTRPPSVGLEMSESPPNHRHSSISKQSNYSSINDVNPYITSHEKGPQYEDLGAMRLNMGINKGSSSKKIKYVIRISSDKRQIRKIS